jgi:hypothetical protein
VPSRAREHHRSRFVTGTVCYQIIQAAVDCEPVPLRPRNPITTRLPEVITAEQRFLTPVEFARLEAAMHPHYQPFIRFHEP